MNAPYHLFEFREVQMPCQRQQRRVIDGTVIDGTAINGTLSLTVRVIEGTVSLTVQGSTLPSFSITMALDVDMA